jgi:hypothetical protein
MHLERKIEKQTLKQKCLKKIIAESKVHRERERDYTNKFNESL